MINTPENILLLTVDALREDDSDPLRNAIPASYDIITVDRCIATGSGTSTAFPGILTSTHPLEYGGYSGIGSDRVPLAEVLSDSGFETAGFHSNPLLSRKFGYNRGFDKFYDSVGSKRRLNRVLRDFLPSSIHRLIKEVYFRLTDYQQLPYDRADDINNRVLDWLNEVEEAWFCWAHYMDPHHPYKPPSKYTNVPEDDIDQFWQQLNDDPNEIPDAEVETLRNLYRSEVSYLADSLSSLFEQLEQEGHLNETLVVLTADHGEEFRDHGDLLHKPKLHRELVEVPLLFTGGCVTETKTIHGLFSALDIPATIIDSIGELPPDNWRGRPVREEETRDACFTELSHTSGEGGEVAPERIKISYRTDDWTFIHDRQADTDRLYSRHSDPMEKEDVSSEHEGLLKDMREAVKIHLEDVVDRTTTGRQTKVDESVEERLSDLGYR
ncbi:MULTISPECIES: sulfatase-like hydrolase/transferase [Salinibaculum]|uniref:sulfatase-like hydrolase/transferase n=1 Tax=Salinibaculum TaxID=2732368 RepID=UPI0030D2CBB1